MPVFLCLSETLFLEFLAPCAGHLADGAFLYCSCTIQILGENKPQK